MNPLFYSFAASCIAAFSAQPVVPPSDTSVVVKAGESMPRPDSNQTILIEINIYQFKAPVQLPASTVDTGARLSPRRELRLPKWQTRRRVVHR
ncbi:MAG: hypothetical protein NTV94_14760 [Planctomycetota bacterium]|nr:hypothetical protein [Planctomycetota bacterium]